MAAIALLHASLPSLMPVSDEFETGGLIVRQAASDPQVFRRNLAMQRIDALVVSLDLLGDEPLTQIDRLRKYTRPKVVVVIYNFTDAATLRAIEDRADLVILREPVTPGRLRRVLAHELDEPELMDVPADAAPGRSEPQSDPVLPAGPAADRRFSEVELHTLLTRASTAGYEYTQHVAELLISVQGFESYCRRRNGGRNEARGLHADIEHGAGHARAILEECLSRLCSATRLERPRERDDEARAAGDNVRPLPLGPDSSGRR